MNTTYVAPSCAFDENTSWSHGGGSVLVPGFSSGVSLNSTVDTYGDISQLKFADDEMVKFSSYQL